MIAEICGIPIPATTLVVQMDPGPIPTFMASALLLSMLWQLHLLPHFPLSVEDLEKQI
jgi:hypothetical protein